jgi:hypothetical protein
MDYNFEVLKKFNINPTKVTKGKRIMKDTRTLLKNVYVKKEKLIRKYKKIKKNTKIKDIKGGSNTKQIESDISEIEILHKNLKNLMFLSNGIIEVYSNS